MVTTIRYLIPLLLCLAMGHAGAQGVLRIATTTTTSAANSGLLDVLIPAFEHTSSNRVEIRTVGSGTALRLGREGQVDVLLVHAPDAEISFVADGDGMMRQAVMHNDFVIVGPLDDPAELAGMTDVVLALARIRDHKALFLSRGDDSGTHKKELELWQAAGIDPYGTSWYQEVGIGIGKLLRSGIRR